MKKLFTLLLLCSGLAGLAQQFNNEWIDFSKIYFKFKTDRTGLCRIPQSALSGLGLGSVPAEQFKMWRNGQEVGLYTSSATGPLAANGYIEFWAQTNDGKPDVPLYRNPAYQHTDKVSLQSDTAVYFLTVDAGLNNHYADAVNDVASNVLPAEPYFMYTSGRYFREQINSGFAAVIGEYVYSSSYDKGEFWSSQDIYPGSPRVDQQSGLSPFTSGPAASIRFGAAGSALNSRSINVKVNNTVVKDTICDYFNDVVGSSAFPVSLLSSGSADVTFSNGQNSNPVITSDRMVVSFYELTYPRQFNFGNASNFSFTLPASASGFYLQITNFNYGSTAPVLYDISNQRKYVGDVTTPGTVKFALPAGGQPRNLRLVSEDPSNYVTLSGTDFTAKKFTDFSLSANQGNYVIISNKVLFNGANGTNPVNDYKLYRSSAAGGGYSAQVYDIDELVDQFAFGIKKHPLSIKNFLRFARAKFAAAPKYTMLIGHGVAYNAYRYNQASPAADLLNLVPTFGWPASDNLLASADGASPVPITPIGRLSVISGDEIANYLEKVKEYEGAQQGNPNTIAGRAWMKNIMQITGASEVYLGSVLCNYMDNYRQLVIDTLIGANVTTFCKNTSAEIEQASNGKISGLFEEGLGFFCYFGHSSSTVLGFNIDDPNNYNNAGKYPFFSVNGCNAGDFFVFDPNRFTYGQTLSEKFTLAKQRGSIGFLASTHYGIVNYLNIFISSFYNLMDKTDYGASVGKINRDAAQQLINISGSGDYYARLHAEEMTLHGDPAIKLDYQALPDYDIEESQVVINPQFVSIAENKFNVQIKLYNLGKAVNDSITVQISRQYPDNSVATLQRVRIPGIRCSDSLTIDVPIIATRDKGLNKLIIKVDADDAVPEITEANNTLTKEFFIYEDEAKPAYPYDFSIVTKQGQKMYASTANPLSTLKQYAMEIDTTTLFNSPVKVSKSISSAGGLLEFDPGVSFQDSTVYYWRTSLVPSSGSDYHWNVSSFVYLPASSGGFNQSHYFQHLESDIKSLSMQTDRQWHFGSHLNNIFILHGIYPTSAKNDADFSVSINANNNIESACIGHSLIFTIIDPVTFKPWLNVDGTGNNLYLYGSASANCKPTRNNNFEFSYMGPAARKKIVDFMDSIPKGSYVVIRNFDYDYNNSFASTWLADSSQPMFTPGNTLYDRLLQAGLFSIDSLNTPRAWAMVYKKNDPSFAPVARISAGLYDRITFSTDCATPDSLGYITSPVFGPAKSWQQVHWRGYSLDTKPGDKPVVQVIGISAAGIETPLFNLDASQQDFDVSSVSVAQYPSMKLRMRNIDSINLTAYQLQYWRVTYNPLPEGAVIPNIYFKAKDPSKTADTLDIGETYNVGVAFKNISPEAFDSLRMRVYILDNNNVSHAIAQPKTKPLAAGDSVQVNYLLDTRAYPGNNTLYIGFNPDNDQPEQYQFNNFLFRNFYVKPDKTNPLMDVTFDNVHILNRDIVSARPHIEIKLKDNAKYLLLNDTAGLMVQVRFPDNSLRSYQFNTDTLRFIPAVRGSDNTATIEFSPQFLKQINEDGDDYQLIVKGKDISGNKAGTSDYNITFRVIGKPMVSNLLNYPNPFTTSTAFVFTLTGSDVPDNMKIQILTVTGKIVKEITRQELGNLHIGRNITDYKWDGTDQFGQRLGNGVYLYRFVTTLNGKRIDKFTDSGDNTNKFFNNGYGKMYLMK